MKLTPPPITPGPWPILELPAEHWAAARILTNEECIAHAQPLGCNSERNANATAIAALPQCLEALAYPLEQVPCIDSESDDGDECGLTVTVGWLREVRDALLAAGYTITED